MEHDETALHRLNQEKLALDDFRGVENRASWLQH